ncbi:MAG: hypothetical protein Q7I97_07085, partial [Thermovirgaceae bacterium]|nr:hypothetical protein [Thermovirgaceae bacterium]
ICVSVAGVELLGIKIRAALASFATAAKYDLEFTNGTNYNTDARKAAQREKETCPQCEKRVPKEELPGEWCGWASARARETVRNTVSESPIAVE